MKSRESFWLIWPPSIKLTFFWYFGVYPGLERSIFDITSYSVSKKCSVSLFLCLCAWLEQDLIILRLTIFTFWRQQCYNDAIVPPSSSSCLRILQIWIFYEANRSFFLRVIGHSPVTIGRVNVPKDIVLKYSTIQDFWPMEWLCTNIFISEKSYKIKSRYSWGTKGLNKTRF